MSKANDSEVKGHVQQWHL